ncbi:HET-domain-containing protein [Xylaria castorea]|nr:HET-domain-containing protein [Xylaria castorea]
MHLLNVHTKQLQEFTGNRIPPYAILSHTWGEDEVLFQDLSTPGYKEKLGYKKIEGCCQEAILDGFEFMWVDTCCIDKRSSAELSEAINSMFRWYDEAQVCYVYLADVSMETEPRADFSKSEWFTQGWTLQELIASTCLKFFDTTWSLMFHVDKTNTNIKLSNIYGQEIEHITGIRRWHEYGSNQIIAGIKSLEGVPVATKLSWASGRNTTRVEDMAYCLLGLLDVNMPLLYGEGHKAFLRLQEEFIKKHHDLTIVSWGLGINRSEICDIEEAFGPGCLAPTPRLFRGFRYVDLEKIHNRLDEAPRLGWTMTTRGLHIELPVVQFDARNNVYIGMTNYTYGGGFLAIPLHKYHDLDAYVSVPYCVPLFLDPAKKTFDLNKVRWKKIYLDSNIYNPIPLSTQSRELEVHMTILYENGFVLDSVYPPTFAVDNHRVRCINEIQSLRTTRLVLTLHREQRNALYLQARSAIQIWDAGRRAWRRGFRSPPHLDWQETTIIDDGSRVECVSSKWQFWRTRLSFSKVNLDNEYAVRVLWSSSTVHINRSPIHYPFKYKRQYGQAKKDKRAR